ncbi:hypothetical protein DSM104443_03195 [Usitatibacter rugosus]|uniref:Ribosomal L7/L12-like protein n=1 Tax=Usitatibacter rugosus TaxID=2732067 RepID=A0A6M4GXV0_9PROT|nr:hypothetical protein [Usitatibacter rugosus]QJR12111.1 hypothetical protein DSM104443_03195 [Usitatibacter rugosus]
MTTEHERGGQASEPVFGKPEGRDAHAQFTLPPEALEALKRGSLIEAIKIIREKSGVGLAEAKSMVEEIARSIPKDGRFGDHTATPQSVHARAGLGPGEVARGGGSGKWLVLIAIAALAILAALFYR